MVDKEIMASLSVSLSLPPPFSPSLPPFLCHFLEEMLQCDAPIVREIAQMRRVSTIPLLALQDYVMKSLEEKW